MKVNMKNSSYEGLQKNIRKSKAPKIETWQNQYRAQPASEEKNFPFKRAANVVIPLTAIAVEAVHARLINTVFSVEPFWSIRPRSQRWVEGAKPIEEWLPADDEQRAPLAR